MVQYGECRDDVEGIVWQLKRCPISRSQLLRRESFAVPHVPELSHRFDSANQERGLTPLGSQEGSAGPRANVQERRRIQMVNRPPEQDRGNIVLGIGTTMLSIVLVS